MTWTRNDFPEGFLFGAATSSYQIEGHGMGGAGPTHWDSFAATPGNVVRAEDGARACAHYTRWPEDLDLLRDLNVDIYRFSTSWARVLPEGTGTPNPEGLDFYHWELPQPLADRGGWRNRDIASWFAEFTETIMGRIGDRLWSAAPINEPWCVSWLSHFEGHHAPGMRDIRATARAMHHVLLAHGRAIEVMRGLGLSNLGGVFNLEWADPADPDNPADVAAAARYDAIYNRFFLGGVFQGHYPAEVLEGLEPHLPQGWQDDFATITQPLDWVGLNYYTRKLIAAAPGPWPGLTEVQGPLPKTQMGWEICPEALYRFIMRVANTHAPDLPIYVTENGMANADRLQGGVIDDPERLAYLDAHLAQCRRAIADGADLRGYIIWSLLDNYEWALGYEKRFGLVHVDFESLKRTPKASYHALERALRRKGG